MVTTSCIQAKLQQITDKKEWLGYFAGWQGRHFDFGIQSNGKSVLHPKKNSKERGKNKQVEIDYILQEKKGEKWITRKFDKFKGLNTKSKTSIDSKKPVSFSITYSNGVIVKWTHEHSGKEVIIRPEIIESNNISELQAKIDVRLPRLHQFGRKQDEKQRGKKVGSDYLKGTRLNDGRKVNYRMKDFNLDPFSEKFFKNGVSSFEFSSTGYLSECTTR